MTDRDEDTPVERPKHLAEPTAVERYIELLEQHRLAREVVRGGLTPTEEAYFVGQLDECWQKMTDEERKVFE